VADPSGGNPYRVALVSARAEVLRVSAAGALYRPRELLARSWYRPAADEFAADGPVFRGAAAGDRGEPGRVGRPDPDGASWFPPVPGSGKWRASVLT
jgi:hypothetical protein